MALLDFSGKNALVIGGTSRVGLEIASLLAAEGASVTVTGRTYSGNLPFIQTDFETDFDVSFSDVEEKVRETDILVVCYGPFVRKSLDSTDSADWKKLALCDYALPGMLVSSALSGMVPRKWGRIVLFGGTRTESVRAYKSNAAYAGAKTGLSVIVKSVSSEYRNKGITCNAILPGFMNNPPEEKVFVDKKLVAKEVIHLIQNKELNGVLLNIDCGWAP